MRLWTIQPEEVYNQIMEDGKYVFDYSKAENAKDFKRSYLWLREQMAIRGITPVTKDEPLVWAWHTYNKKHHKPDLRTSGFGTRGDRAVCMEIEIPDDKVLLSDFDAWHFVLNNWYFDDSTNESEWEQAHEWFDSLPYPQNQEVREKSWQKVFDTSLYESSWSSRGKYVQATFYGLKKEDIINQWHFVCK